MRSSKMNFPTDFTPVHLLSEMPASTPVLLALSGGADSRALLELLYEYCQKNGAPLSVAHVNHMIRGADAERDRDFCRALAEKYSLPFYLLEADVPTLAKANRRGLEEEARAVRYDFFENVMRENGIPILATAHNATDNAETVIFNLSRGSGLRGLCGIPSSRPFGGGIIVRPLLKMSKAKILSYCEKNRLEYVTDETNTDVAYSRNRIRNNILPELCEINENAIENISRACELIKGDEEFIGKCAKEFIGSLEDRFLIPIQGFSELDPAIRSRVAAATLGELFDVSAVHVTAFCELAEKSVPHSSLTFPCETVATVENGFVKIEKAKSPAAVCDYLIKIELGENEIPQIGGVILAEEAENTEFSSAKHINLKNVYKKSTTTLISFDRINNGLFSRPKKEGDKILFGAMHKKLKKLFCDKKLSLEERARTPIICDGEGVLWIPYVALRDKANSEKRKIRLTFYHN